MGIRYTDTEKLEFIRNANTLKKEGLTLKEACKQIGISDASYHTWKHLQNGQHEPEAVYVEQLQLELDRLRKENDLLIKKLGKLLVERELRS